MQGAGCPADARRQAEDCEGLQRELPAPSLATAASHRCAARSVPYLRVCSQVGMCSSGWRCAHLLLGSRHCLARWCRNTLPLRMGLLPCTHRGSRGTAGRLHLGQMQVAAPGAVASVAQGAGGCTWRPIRSRLDCVVCLRCTAAAPVGGTTALAPIITRCVVLLQQCMCSVAQPHVSQPNCPAGLLAAHAVLARHSTQPSCRCWKQ